MKNSYITRLVAQIYSSKLVQLPINCSVYWQPKQIDMVMGPHIQPNRFIKIKHPTPPFFSFAPVLLLIETWDNLVYFSLKALIFFSLPKELLFSITVLRYVLYWWYSRILTNINSVTKYIMNTGIRNPKRKSKIPIHNGQYDTYWPIFKSLRIVQYIDLRQYYVIAILTNNCFWLKCSI